MKNQITLNDGTIIYGSQVDRFTNLETARKYAAKKFGYVAPILGDDGKYWVAANTRIQGKLIKAGYELVGA